MKREDTHLTNEELVRYSRQLVLPAIGLEGQRKLKSSSVAIVGAGGLGSPAALYLAAAGVGRIGVIDFDVVDLSNLHRQVLFTTTDIGTPKVDVAKERIRQINPAVEVDTYAVKLTSENGLDVLSKYDVAIDGTDNFPSRYLINDACVLLGKPNVYGSIFRFEGQASVFSFKGGPCYRCAYPMPPPPDAVPSCAEAGVLGVLPGIIGTMQAAEAIKVILGIGTTLAGTLLLLDGLTMQFREMRLRRNAACPVCGDHPTVTKLIDYEEFCGVKKSLEQVENHLPNEISVGQLKRKMDRGDDVFLLDVRERIEYEFVHLDAHLVPLGELARRLHEIDRQKEIVVYCHHGNRSRQAVEFLTANGYRNVKNLVGGINAWAKHVDPSMARY